MKTKINTSLLKQAVRVFEDKIHFGLNRVKTRAEVNRTKKKLYKQKGTGGARHGARSAPIFVGGGKAHGPKGVKTVLNMSVKMKKKALSVALTFKFDKKEAQFIEGLEKVKKTSDAAKIIKKLKLGGKVLVILSESNKFFRNIKNVKALNFKDINVYEVMKFNNILVDKRIKLK